MKKIVLATALLAGLASMSSNAAGGPPDVAACEGKAGGAECSFGTDSKPILGICIIVPPPTLRCMPSPPQELACRGQSEKAACTYTPPGKPAVNGTCQVRAVPGGKTLACK